MKRSEPHCGHPPARAQPAPRAAAQRSAEGRSAEALPSTHLDRRDGFAVVDELDVLDRRADPPGLGGERTTVLGDDAVHGVGLEERGDARAEHCCVLCERWRDLVVGEVDWEACGGGGRGPCAAVSWSGHTGRRPLLLPVSGCEWRWAAQARLQPCIQG
jgi:hypothetical protein